MSAPALRTALVTGAAQGIGKVIALQLAKDGYQVALTDIPAQEAKALEVVKEINNLKQKSIFIPADSSNKDQIFAAVEKTYQELGGFNTIVNNAGIGASSAVVDITPEELERVTKINIGGVVWGIQAAAKKFEELKQPGKIINAGSILSFTSIPNAGSYIASKFAVRGLTQIAARELAPKEITVNSYCPGIIQTAIWDSVNERSGDYTGATKDKYLKDLVEGSAMKRVGQPQDVANLVSFLASEKSNYITGQCYIVDGGMAFA